MLCTMPSPRCSRSWSWATIPSTFVKSPQSRLKSSAASMLFCAASSNQSKKSLFGLRGFHCFRVSTSSSGFSCGWFRRIAVGSRRRGGFRLHDRFGLLHALPLDARLFWPLGDQRAQSLRQQAHDALQECQVAGRDVVELVAVERQGQSVLDAVRAVTTL